VTLIKRYPNRKLYDTEAKHYIALDDVAALVRAGAEVRVVDHASGDDLTALILMQVIVEQEKQRSGSTPRSALAGLMQAGGDTFDAVRRALLPLSEAARQADEEIERRIQDLIRLGELAEDEGLRLRDKLLAQSQRLAHAWPDEGRLRQLVASLGVPTRSDMRTLADQLAALEAEIALLEATAHDD
jgi:polyhydroxyalkanoate synthesis repressor PhaR